MALLLERPQVRRGDGTADGVEGNRRLISPTAIVLLVLLFVERVGHRSVRCDAASRADREAGPPHGILRPLGPLGPLVVPSTRTRFGHLGGTIREQPSRRVARRGKTARGAAIAIAVRAGVCIALLTPHLAGPFWHAHVDGRLGSAR